VPSEAAALAELQNRSSTHWGYPPDFFDWAPEASIIPEAYVRDNPVFVLEERGVPLGFYAFTMEDGELLLDKLFVDVDQIGTGCGKLLWQHAVQYAFNQGHEHFNIGSDPNAAGFYEARGAEWFAEKPTPEPRWTVQMYRYAIPPREMRLATLADAAALHALTQRSTMHWGYPPEFLDWAPESIAVTPEFLAKATTWILWAGGEPIGYYSLVMEDNGLHLDKLFVDSTYIGTGSGQRLWKHALATAREMGATTLSFGADPNAAPFYRAMGAEWVREFKTDWPGWRLQDFRVDLAQPDTRTNGYFRAATAADVDALNTLTRASQLSWGYDPAFLDWATDIVVHPEWIEEFPVVMRYENGELVGFYGLGKEEDEWHLRMFFVAAQHIRTGVGRRMWPHLVQTVWGQGVDTLMIWSEPNAVGFYRAMGAEWVREKPMSWPGFVLHLMRYQVPPESVS
jgi:GNAT superfamily N-acetyltransferase